MHKITPLHELQHKGFVMPLFHPIVHLKTEKIYGETVVIFYVGHDHGNNSYQDESEIQLTNNRDKSPE